MRLFLCENPSQGKDIGRILGATQRGEGCLNGSGVVVTWCIGHLVEAAAPEVYDAALKRWSLEQLPIIPQQWRVEVKPKTATQFKVVKALRSEEHTSELQSLMRTSYAVFCFKKKKKNNAQNHNKQHQHS